MYKCASHLELVSTRARMPSIVHIEVIKRSHMWNDRIPRFEVEMVVSFSIECSNYPKEVMERSLVVHFQQWSALPSST